LAEHYFYTQEISRNSTLRTRQDPVGRIEVLVPYDGYKYVTRPACADIQRQVKSHSSSISALIGHMVLDDYSRTNLGDLLELEDHWGSVPLRMPVVDGVLIDAEHLYDDQHSCRITHPYKPKQPDVNPLQIELMLLDEDYPELLEPDRLSNSAKIQALQAMIEQAVGRVSQRRTLYLFATVQLTLPRNRAPADGQPSIKQMALGWPTITSLDSMHLFVDDQSHPIMYNPEKKRVEWGNIPLASVPLLPGTDMCCYRSAPICLWIEQPGELYRQNELDGQIEVEISGSLLSGLKAQVYDGTGRRQTQLQTQLATHITNDFQFVLDDAFARRPQALYQRLNFDGVIPEEARISDISATLGDRGFQLVDDRRLANGPNSLHHFILGQRSEGAALMNLLMFIKGTRYSVKRQEKMPDGTTLTADINSGDIEIYMRGELVGQSQRLTHQMNAVQAALRDRFVHLRSKR
jgi:hypothetical protein